MISIRDTTDHDIRARLEALVRVNRHARICTGEDRWEVLLLTPRVLLPIHAAEFDLVISECATVRGAVHGVPLRFVLDQDEPVKLLGGMKVGVFYDVEEDF